MRYLVKIYNGYLDNNLFPHLFRHLFLPNKAFIVGNSSLSNQSGFIKHISQSAPLIYETAPNTSKPMVFPGFCFDSPFKGHYLCFLNPHA